MAVTKTRNRLVDVARQIFAKRGLENTTMNDIAVASGKGRRTLYTYFKSKEDLYLAVIEGELVRLLQYMNEMASTSEMSAEEKLVSLIYTHLNLVKEAVQRNGNLRAEFFRDIITVERVRKRFDDAEIELFFLCTPCGIAEEGDILRVVLADHRFCHRFQCFTDRIIHGALLSELFFCALLYISNGENGKRR